LLRRARREVATIVDRKERRGLMAKKKSKKKDKKGKKK